MAVWWLETSRGRTSEVLPCRRAELEEGDVIFHELPLHVKPDRVSAYGARHKGLSSPRKSSYCRLVKVLRLSTDRLRPVTLWEPPGADPHARWCGGRGRKTPAYPISNLVASSLPTCDVAVIVSGFSPSNVMVTFSVLSMVTLVGFCPLDLRMSCSNPNAPAIPVICRNEAHAWASGPENRPTNL